MKTLAIVILGSLAVTACDLISDDEGPVLVTISGPAGVVGERTTNDNGQAIVQCQVELEASAHGGGTFDVAIWSAAVVEWTDLATGEVQQQRTWDAETVAGHWGSAQLRPDQTRTATWLFWSYAPFQLSADFVYRDSSTDRDRSTQYSFRCE